jgi:hypothetical protein
MDDRAVVEAQLERTVRSAVRIESRCHLGLPVVTEVPPILDDGTPFPTTHWLTCPLATRRIGRLEAAGGVAEADELVDTDPEFAAAFEAAMNRYESERDRMIPADHTGPRPSGGVAGSSRGVKCLHAHYADTAAGNDNPVGARTASAIEPLDCAVPCVIEMDGSTVRNPSWVEPK